MSGRTGSGWRGRRVLIDISPLRESAAFRRIFVARLISLVGIGLLLVAVPLQTYHLTGSSTQVGAVTAVTGITTFVGMLVGGGLADRFDRRRLILVGRGGAVGSFAGLAANAFGVFGGDPRMWVVYVFAGVDGLVGALSVTALMAAVPTLVPRTSLVAVGALGALSVRVGTAVSPGIAGLLLAAVGFAWTYLAAAVLAAFTLLILCGLPALSPHTPAGGERAEAVAQPPAPAGGVVAFLRAEPVVGSVMVLGMLTMAGAGIVALLPALVAERFGGDERTAGLFYAAVAAGAALAALTSGWLSAVRAPGRLLLSCLVVTFILVIVFGLTTLAWAATLVLLLVGFGEAVQEVLRYSLITHHTPGRFLGRVSAIWSAQEVAGVTVGAVLAGIAGSLWAPSQAVVGYGVVLLVLALIAACTMRAGLGLRGSFAGADEHLSPSAMPDDWPR